MGLINVLFGRPLASSEDEGERITPTQGIPTFGLDALSSAAYGPEAALTILLPLGLIGVQYIVPLTFAIIGLLVIVYFSYRQTIAAYPNGGGSYTVAKENLGEGAGLLAGAALMIDYLLNVAVGISAGIGALVSAVPSLQPHTLAIVSGGAGDIDGGQSSRSERGGVGIRGSYIFFCGNAGDRDCGGTL